MKSTLTDGHVENFHQDCPRKKNTLLIENFFYTVSAWLFLYVC